MHWIIVCDQPFEEVERPEFHTLLEYTYHRQAPLQIPSSTTVKRRIMDMGEQSRIKMKELITVCF